MEHPRAVGKLEFSPIDIPGDDRVRHDDDVASTGAGVDAAGLMRRDVGGHGAVDQRQFVDTIEAASAWRTISANRAIPNRRFATAYSAATSATIARLHADHCVADNRAGFEGEMAIVTV